MIATINKGRMNSQQLMLNINRIYKKTPCVLIQIESSNPLVLKRQIDKMLRATAFELACSPDIFANQKQKPAFERAKRIFNEGSQPFPVRFHTREEWLKQQDKIQSKIYNTFINIERGKHNFPTYNEEEVKIFQFIQVFDQTKEVSDESSGGISSKGKNRTDSDETGLKTVYLLCAFHTVNSSEEDQ